MVEKTSAHHDPAATSPGPPRESFRELANRLPHGAIIMRNGRIVFANDAIARMLGYENGRELEGESHEKVVAPHDRRRMTRNLERRLRGELVGSQIEFQAIRKDGSPVWLESIATVVEWRGEPAVQATVRQTAQPRRFEEKLRESEAKYQRLVESSVQGLVVFGETVLFANRAAARIFGYSRAETLVGKKPYRFVARHDRHRLKGLEEAAIRGENMRDRFEFEGLRADGSLVWIESVATIVNWEGRRSFQMTLLDVTERKRAETELKEKTLLLEQILENLPIGLNVVDKNLKLLHHNPRYRELMGFPEREVRKWKTFEDAIRFNAQRGEYGPGEVKKIVAERVRQAKRPEPRHYERMRPNGAWIEVRSNPLPQGGFISTFSDVTSRKKAEEALRLSEERHRDLVEGSLQGVLIHRDSKPLFANQAVAGIFGYPSPAEILVLRDVMKLVPSEDRKRIRENHGRRLRGEKVPTRYEARAVRKDGTVFWVEVLNRVVNWDGQPAVQGTINDISERKRAEQDLRENERLLQTVFDVIPHSIFVKDRKSRYLMVNSATGRRYNVDPAEFRDSHTADHTFADAATIENFLKTDRRVIRTGQPVDLPEEQLILRNGEKRYHHLIKLPLRDDNGKVIGLVGLAEDITERKKAEDERRAGERLLQTVFDTIPHAVFVKDKRCRFLMVNSAMGKRWNLDPSKIRGARAQELPMGDEANMKMFLRTDRQVLRTGERLDLPEEPLVLKNGERRIHHLIKLPLRDDNGKVIGLVGLSEDITERKKAEDERRAGERLLQTVFDTIPHGVFVKDRESRYIMVNAAMAARQGRVPQDFLGGHTLEMMPGPAEEREFRVQKDRQVLETGERVDIPEFVVTMSTGEKQVQHIIKLPLRDESGEVIGIVGLSEDITERKRAEEELQASQRLLETIFNTVPNFLWVKDRDGRYLKVNPALAKSHDLTTGHIEGLLTEETNVATAEDRTGFAESDRQVFETGKQIEIPELAVTLPNGERRLRHVMKLPLKDEHGNVTGLVGVSVDITERKRAEEALRANERLLQTIFEVLPLGVSVKDTEGRYLMVNRSLTEDYHLKPEDYLGIRTQRMPFGTPGERKALAKADSQAIRTRERVDLPEFQVTLPGGEKRIRNISKIPFLDAEGAVDGVVGVSEDITERKRAEEALRASEANFRNLAEGSIQGILIQRDQKPLFINRAFAQMLGYESPEEIYRLRSLAPLLASEDRKRLTAYRKARMKGEPAPAHYEGRAMRKDGSQIWLETLVNVVAWEGQPAILATGVDITERKRAEEALRANQRLLRTVFDTIPTGVYVKDRECKFIMVNRALADVVGLEPEQMENHTIAELGYGSEEEIRKIEETDQRVLKHGERIDIPEWAFTLPSGELRWRHSIKGPLHDHQGRIIGIVGVREDITERKRAEQAMLQAQKLESLGVLAGGIAHDFNNILVAVLGNAGLAMMDLPSDSPAREAIHQIEIAGQRAAELCRQMLAYSGRGNFASEFVDLNGIVEEMTQLLQVSISKSIVLKYNLDATLPPISADRSQIQQVVMNLVINASESFDQQSGVISISSGVVWANTAYLETTLMGSALKEAEYVFLEVSDTGVGMDSETLQRIFDPFFTTKFTGRGLGLAAVLGIVKAHKGALKVYSEVGQGSTFKLLLPVAKGEVAALPSSEDTSEWQGSGTFLIVDDEAPIRKVTARMLEKLGFQVMEAAGGKEGVELFRAHSAEIVGVLLDLTMPDLSGEETYREIRRIKKKTLVLLMSGYNETEVANRFAGRQVSGFLQKPFRLPTLRSKLETLFK